VGSERTNGRMIEARSAAGLSTYLKYQKKRIQRYRYYAVLEYTEHLKYTPVSVSEGGSIPEPFNLNDVTVWSDLICKFVCQRFRSRSEWYF
jgi:hypothetical protein